MEEKIKPNKCPERQPGVTMRIRKNSTQHYPK